MRVDTYGQIILSENDLCDLYLKDPSLVIKRCLVDSPILFDSSLELTNTPTIIESIDDSRSIVEFDRHLQQKWHIPEEYKTLDIAKYVLDLCQTEVERQRVGQELMLYLDRNLFPLLQYMKYLVDTMRKHNIVWGVGRGSSVSSYVLYLLGVHKIDSLFFDLDIYDFLR
jgi:DNA polymerase III alpha subunit